MLAATRGLCAAEREKIERRFETIAQHVSRDAEALRSGAREIPRRSETKLLLSEVFSWLRAPLRKALRVAANGVGKFRLSRLFLPMRLAINPAMAMDQNCLHTHT